MFNKKDSNNYNNNYNNYDIYGRDYFLPYLQCLDYIIYGEKLTLGLSFCPFKFSSWT